MLEERVEIGSLQTSTNGRPKGENRNVPLTERSFFLPFFFIDTWGRQHIPFLIPLCYAGRQSLLSNWYGLFRISRFEDEVSLRRTK